MKESCSLCHGFLMFELQQCGHPKAMLWESRYEAVLFNAFPGFFPCAFFVVVVLFCKSR